VFGLAGRQRGSQRRRLLVSFELAEDLGGFAHGCAGPTQRHRASCQYFAPSITASLRLKASDAFQHRSGHPPSGRKSANGWTAVEAGPGATCRPSATFGRSREVRFCPTIEMAGAVIAEAASCAYCVKLRIGFVRGASYVVRFRLRLVAG
jgi:hypothetical protein